MIHTFGTQEFQSFGGTEERLLYTDNFHKMSYIYTATNKWDDAWFSNLSNDAKILFYYISEKCNNAGFYEINKPTMLVQTKMNEARSRECFIEIKKAYVMSIDRQAEIKKEQNNQI